MVLKQGQAVCCTPKFKIAEICTTNYTRLELRNAERGSSPGREALQFWVFESVKGWPKYQSRRLPYYGTTANCLRQQTFQLKVNWLTTLGSAELHSLIQRILLLKPDTHYPTCVA